MDLGTIFLIATLLTLVISQFLLMGRVSEAERQIKRMKEDIKEANSIEEKWEVYDALRMLGLRREPATTTRATWVRAAAPQGEPR
jgi:hypothetical protein